MSKDSQDSYIAAAPEQFRAVLGHLRAQLARALPEAKEVIEYDMPGFQIEDTIVAAYAAFSNIAVYMSIRAQLLAMPTRLRH